MKYDLDPDTRAVLAAVIAGEDVVHYDYYASGSGCWVTVDAHNSTSPLIMAASGAKLRLKPKTIRIGEYDVPEPMRVAPKLGSGFWRVNIWCPVEPHYCEYRCSPYEAKCLEASLCHATKEAAITHAKALRSLTEVNP